MPAALKRVKGVYVENVAGKSYLNCLSGAGAPALGHYHPVVEEAIQQTWSAGFPAQMPSKLPKLVKKNSGRRSNLAFQGAYHGMHR